MKKQKFNKNDFGINNLPSTRKDLFFDVLKHKYKFILLIGFVLFLFALPQFFLNYVFSNMVSSILNDANLIGNGGILNEAGMNAYNSSIVIFACCHFVTFFIFFIGLSGAIRIFKLLSFNEGLLFWDDFWIGIKQNFKQFVVLSLILSLGLCIFNLTRIIDNMLLKGVIYGITFGVFIPFVVMAIIYSSIYSIKTNKMLLNSFALYVKNFLFLLMIPLFVLVYLAIDFIPLLFVAYLVKAVFIIFLVPIMILGIYLKCLNIFDELINKTAHKELIDKGLYKQGSKQ